MQIISDPLKPDFDGATRLTMLFVGVIALAVACTTTSEPEPKAQVAAADHTAHMIKNGDLTVEQRQGIAAVRNATAKFHVFDVSQQAGYTTQFPAGCKETADGAQGFHYLNAELVDDKVELLRPELVMYEPQRDGSLQLIGVDYVVPYTLRPATGPAPELLGVPFMRNDPLGVWALHIWAWRPNPSGMFAMWNPSASCAFAK